MSIFSVRNSNIYDTSDLEQMVQCPKCDEGKLRPRFTCLSTAFVCSECKTELELEDLAPVVSDDEFEQLASLIGHRYSDRI